MMRPLENFHVHALDMTKYLFFTGKGGVGKTSTACAVAVTLADEGKKVLLVSTDPASNLQDVFNMPIDGSGITLPEVPGLVIANLNPEEAASAYRESVVGPFRGKLPESVIANMEEQLSGSCTVEIAAFDQFSNYIADQSVSEAYDHIIFDTAPTGHTLRMLQLPSAWSHFISESTHGASCLGQLAGLDEKKDIYKTAVKNLADPVKTTLVLVSRPEETPLLEAERSSLELQALGINNQILIINGVLNHFTDAVSEAIVNKQNHALENFPKALETLKTFRIPLRSYNLLGIDRLRDFLLRDKLEDATETSISHMGQSFEDLVKDLSQSGKKVIFTMGKGGVGKTTVASALAVSLVNRGHKVHLTSTDPANHLGHVAKAIPNLTISAIDEKAELLKYQTEVLSAAQETMADADLDYLKEDLRSPCTQEIALFRAFAEIVEKADNEIVVIDTAPTGHTLLLLDSTQSYHKEVQRTRGEAPTSVQKLLPRLRDASQTEVIIVTLPEATPVFEADRLKADLERAGINNRWWIVNQCLSIANSSDPMLKARGSAERKWIEQVRVLSTDKLVTLPWLSEVTIPLAPHF